MVDINFFFFYDQVKKKKTLSQAINGMATRACHPKKLKADILLAVYSV